MQEVCKSALVDTIDYCCKRSSLGKHEPMNDTPLMNNILSSRITFLFLIQFVKGMPRARIVKRSILTAWKNSKLSSTLQNLRGIIKVTENHLYIATFVLIAYTQTEYFVPVVIDIKPSNVLLSATTWSRPVGAVVTSTPENIADRRPPSHFLLISGQLGNNGRAGD